MIATFLATALIVVFVSINIARQLRTGNLFEPAYTSLLVCSLVIFVGGATLANGLFHFLHGILGFNEFPAPFSMIVKDALFTNIANVIWGVLNFCVTTFITMSYRRAVPRYVFLLSLLIGFTVVSALLRFVLLAIYFQTHGF